jgi:hypothetical protein
MMKVGLTINRNGLVNHWSSDCSIAYSDLFYVVRVHTPVADTIVPLTVQRPV